MNFSSVLQKNNLNIMPSLALIYFNRIYYFCQIGTDLLSVNILNSCVKFDQMIQQNELISITIMFSKVRSASAYAPTLMCKENLTKGEKTVNGQEINPI